MVKKILAALIILAMIFSVTGVMAKEDSSGGGSDQGKSSDSASGSSDSSTPHATDTPGDDHGGSVSPRATGTPGDDRSGSSDNAGRSSSGDSSGSGSDRSNSGRNESLSSHDNSSRDATEIEIEHGISTITTHENEHRSNQSLSSGSDDSGRHSRDSAKLATTSLTALSNVSGTTAFQLAEHAKRVEDSLPHLSADEAAIRNRSGLVTFFFGGDKSAASDIVARITDDLAALDAMDEILNDPATSPALKTFTLQREVVIRAELERLKQVAESETQKRGLFG